MSDNYEKTLLPDTLEVQEAVQTLYKAALPQVGNIGDKKSIADRATKARTMIIRYLYDKGDDFAIEVDVDFDLSARLSDRGSYHRVS